MLDARDLGSQEMMVSGFGFLEQSALESSKKSCRRAYFFLVLPRALHWQSDIGDSDVVGIQSMALTPSIALG
jgi:hypothetical protein